MTSPTTTTETKIWNNNLIWFWTFFMWTDVTQTANIALQTVFWFQTITVIVPLQKFREKLSKGAITNDHSNGSTSPSRLSTNVTITEKLKNPKFSQQEVAVFTRNRTNKQLWQKSRFRFDCKNTTFCEHHKYKQKSQIDWCYGFMKTSFRSCFKFGIFSTNAPKREQHCL